MITYDHIQIIYGDIFQHTDFIQLHAIYILAFLTAFGDSGNEGGQNPSFDGGPGLADIDQEPDAHDPGPVTAA